MEAFVDRLRLITKEPELEDRIAALCDLVYDVVLERNVAIAMFAKEVRMDEQEVMDMVRLAIDSAKRENEI